ncbi:bifunctional acetate--CoA ligase family protein/GNAT family N-acetyltransferase [Roseivivax sp. CAU 1753]
MGPNPLQPLFDPKSIAVFGASDRVGSVGGKVFSNLLAGGFEGPIHPINAKYDSVAGRPCFASLAEVGQQVDLAVIATPASTLPQIIRDCGAAGTRNAIILSAGFGEQGADGRAREAALVDAARAAGVRFLGPNCVGMVRPWVGMDATFLNSAPPKGRIALVSQSGALCSAISDWAGPNHLGFSALVSMGNSANIGFGDTLRYLAEDRHTDAILLYVEGVRDARGFISSARHAAATKPVIVLKAGRHAQSSKAAHTHTGALMGSDAMFDAALERTGAVRVDTFGQLFAAAEILAPNRRTAGNRLGIVTNGGGAGVLAADRVGDLGIALPQPGAATLAELDALLPPFWSHGNPVDILGDATPDAYRVAVKAMLAEPSTDGVLVMLTPQAVTNATEAAQAVLDAAQGSKKPILTCWMGESSVTEARHLLSAAGIPDFTTPERAVEAFSFLAQHRRNRTLALETPGPLSGARPPDIDGARTILATALSDGREMLSDIESKAVLTAFHIPVTATRAAATAAEAQAVADTLGYPVAVKIASPQISHKSDVNGVRMNIQSAEAVRAAFDAVTAAARAARPDATISGVTVEAMADLEHARELVVGAVKDPVFGPGILFGAGGTMVEILRDSATALPPLTTILANRLIDRTRVARLLDTFRDQPAVDRDAVVKVLMRLSDMVCELPEIAELDINPLFATPHGVIAVDARIRVAPRPASAQDYDHMAILPYPRHLVQRGTLANGDAVTIRPIRPEDAESEQTFIRELSPESRKFRFMGTMKELSAEMLVQFTQIDYAREMALIAELGEGADARQGAVARYVINPDAHSCEFAVVVSDRMQGKGLGTRIMTALMDAARLHGLDTIEGTVLRQNGPMLQLMQDLGFSITPSPGDPDLVAVSRRL